MVLAHHCQHCQLELGQTRHKVHMADSLKIAKMAVARARLNPSIEAMICLTSSPLALGKFGTGRSLWEGGYRLH
jgi:hypothetical protein